MTHPTDVVSDPFVLTNNVHTVYRFSKRRIHHDKHHATYVANINKATEGKDEVPILDLMESAIEAGPGVRNNGKSPPSSFKALLVLTWALF